MKLRTVKGKWILTDEGKNIVQDNGAYVWAYMLIETIFKKIPCTAPPQRPVRSLTPNPKPIVLTREDQIKINRIKASMPPRFDI